MRAGRRALRRPALAVAALAALSAGPGCGRAGETGATALEAAAGDAGGASGEAAARPSGVPRARAPEWRGNYQIDPLPAEALALDGAADGLDDLLETIERGLAERDTAGLRALLPTEREYREILYPAFPAAHPPIHASFETVWLLQLGDTWDGLKRILREYGGRDVEILDVRFVRPDQDFVNFRLHEASEVDLLVDGEPRSGVRLFGSVVQVGDRWKVLSYPDD
ncbi:MAG TPA: hypothetical protein VM778_00950 [Gemmatimonadota bacterium]|nr:hypothetical protein [Gemmatimonadota bacterium]